MASAAAALAVALALPASASASALDEIPTDDGAVAADHLGHAQRTLDYWTAKRMRNATPLEVEAPNPAKAAAAAARAWRNRGEPIEIPPAAPQGWVPGGTAPVAPSATPDDGRQAAIPYTSFEVFDTTTYPNVVHGIVFFRLGRASYSCSGTVVNSPSQSVVVTAGHCVHYGGKGTGWATHWIFVPGYHDKAAPFGAWAARQLVTTKLWRKRARFSGDIGAAVMSPNPLGQTFDVPVGPRSGVRGPRSRRTIRVN